jgi:hypothetical protein
MDTVVNVLCAAICCVPVVVALSSTRYIIRRLSAFLLSDFCAQILWSDFCPQNFSSTFIEPSAKPTRTRVLGTNECLTRSLSLNQAGLHAEVVVLAVVLR